MEIESRLCCWYILTYDSTPCFFLEMLNTVAVCTCPDELSVGSKDLDTVALNSVTVSTVQTRRAWP